MTDSPSPSDLDRLERLAREIAKRDAPANFMEVEAAVVLELIGEVKRLRVQLSKSRAAPGGANSPYVRLRAGRVSLPRVPKLRRADAKVRLPHRLPERRVRWCSAVNRRALCAPGQGREPARRSTRTNTAACGARSSRRHRTPEQPA